jgi:hypothetical protein
MAGAGFVPGSSGYVAPSSSDDNPLINDWDHREAVQDHTNQNYNDSLNDVQRYNGPDGEEQLPSGYGQAWSGDNGTRVMSDDPGYNPNESSSPETFTPMEPSSSSSDSSSSSE